MNSLVVRLRGERLAPLSAPGASKQPQAEQGDHRARQQQDQATFNEQQPAIEQAREQGQREDAAHGQEGYADDGEDPIHARCPRDGENFAERRLSFPRARFTTLIFQALDPVAVPRALAFPRPFEAAGVPFAAPVRVGGRHANRRRYGVDMRSRVLFMYVVALLSAGAVLAADTPSRVEQLRDEARALAPLVRTALARDFLGVVPRLPRVAARTVYRDSARTRAWSAREAEALPDSVRAKLVSRTLDEKFYYDTRYGTPLAYVRALELLGQQGVTNVRGKRVADFGCGMLGQLRLLAELGAHTVGIDVDPLLPALYSEPGDQGQVGAGSVRLTTGQWPADDRVVAEVGTALDLFLSKNTLKNGYLHPAEKVDPRMLVHLGVSDSAFVVALARSVKRGGHVLIYNLCPAPAAPGKPYIPWADGRCPFPRATWEQAGFRVVAFDRDDSAASRAMAHALGWDAGEGGMNLERDLFATWSLFERR